MLTPHPPQRCELCRRPGATVGCCLAACVANYHFMCARRRRAAFQRDKKVFCQRHTALLDGTVSGGGSLCFSMGLPHRLLVDDGALFLTERCDGAGLELQKGETSMPISAN